MVNDAFYVLMAALYVGSVLAAAGISLKTGFWREEETRKYVHVSVSFTAFIIAYCISSPLLRLIGPVAFIFINAYSGYKTKARLGGLLLYPVSLALLAVAMNLGIISQSVFVTSRYSASSGCTVSFPHTQFSPSRMLSIVCESACSISKSRWRSCARALRRSCSS